MSRFNRTGATPGGNSQITFGDQGGAQGAAPSSNTWARNDSQNSGNFISERSSTRLHAPPGGHSSFSFGEPGAVDDRFAHHANKSTRAASENTTTNIAASTATTKTVSSGSVSSNAWASNGNQNSGNFISDRSTTRVLAPPGGRNAMGSSFGWN
jgi:SPIRAL1-like protein